MRTTIKQAFATQAASVALLMVMLLTAASCQKEEKEAPNEWKATNEAAIKKLAFESDYTPVNDPAGFGTLYIKWLKRGEGKRVYYTSHADVYYKGMLIDRTTFDKREFEDGEPFKVALSSGVSTAEYSAGVISGWLLSLQYMTEGDKCEVWIPQALAYGSIDKPGIPGYSTLIFEIEVVDVKQQ